VFRDVLHRLGSEPASVRYFHFSGQPVFDERNKFKGYRGIARDFSAQVRAERLVQLESALAQMLAGANDLSTGLTAVIRAMCEALTWAAGNFWTVDAQRDTLRHEVGWNSLGEERRSMLSSGDRLPHWLTHGPVWIGDTTRNPRTSHLEPAEADGWSTGLLIPVKAGGATIGVLDFYAPRVAAPEPQFLKLVRNAGAEIGRVYQRAHALDRLRESEERFSSTMALAAIGIAHVEDDGRFRYVCAPVRSSRSRWRSATCARTDRRFGSVSRSLASAIATASASTTSRSSRTSPRANAPKSASNISRRTTGLTGLPNRLMFMQLLGLSIETARRYGRKLAVLFIDLDRFKIINDTLGHEAGDVLFREVSVRLRECLRAADVVERLGGDEFVVLLQEVDQERAASVARDILSVVMKPVVILGQECRVTASVGVCLHPDDGQDDQAIMKNADMAMYLAKEEGKNNFQFFTSGMKPQSIERLALESNLRRALELDEFSLHYQAKVNFKSGAITGVEALLRWHNPELGSVPPTRFIPLAEDTGLIVPIGAWVLRTACAQSVAWQKQGLPPVCLSVNLSMRQLNDEGLVGEIQRVLSETGLSPELLELEVTESAIMHDAERAVRVLTAIKNLGVRLAIDDFGTGYSSLAHLKRFPIDTLKVDRSFIREVPNDAEDRAIAEAIIAMGKTLSLTVVAEGVETPEQQAFLSDRQCDEMQGYYFSTPVAAQDFAELLREYSPKPLH
jgi:diguanylate cyclase (GGDEF)-like protein